jgi:hypothetical protein
MHTEKVCWWETTTSRILLPVLMQTLPDSKTAALVRVAICPGRMQQVANFLQQF